MTTSSRYLSRHAYAFGRYGKQQIKHIAGSGNLTLCGRRLSDPYTVFESEHKLCTRCANARTIIQQRNHP